MKRDGLPEHQRWTDDGCDIHPVCLSCPLSACRFDLPPGRARSLKTAADLGELLRGGRTMDEAAEALGVSRRTVYRLRREVLGWTSPPGQAASG